MSDREVTTRENHARLQHLEYMVDSMVPSHHRIISEWAENHPDHKQILRTGLSETGTPVIRQNILRLVFAGPTVGFLVLLLVLAMIPSSTFSSPGVYIFLLLALLVLFGLFIGYFMTYMKEIAYNSELVIAYFTDWKELVEVVADLGTITTNSWNIEEIQGITLFKHTQPSALAHRVRDGRERLLGLPSATHLITKATLSLDLELAGTGDGSVYREILSSGVPVSVSLHEQFYELALQKLGQVIGLTEEKLKIVEI